MPPSHKESLYLMHLEEFDFFYVSSLVLLLLLFLTLRWLLRRQKRTQHDSPWFFLGWNVALTAFLLSLLFVGGETWYRFFVDRTDAVGMMKVAKRWHQRHYRFNAQGWRDNVNYELQPETSRRMTFLGDSFAAGAGIKDVDDRFSNLLRARLPETEVHVLARNGFSSKDHLNTVDDLLGWDYPTDAVVLVYMMNDIAPWVPVSGAVYHEMVRSEYALSYLERESYFLNTLTFRWKALRNPDFGQYLYGMRDAYGGDGWKENTAVLRQIRQRLEGVGIPLYVVTFPFMQDLKDYAFEAEHQRLADFWQSEGVPHLDLLPVLLEHADRPLIVHKWDAHPNEYTNRVAADAIQAFLEEEVGKVAMSR